MPSERPRILIVGGDSVIGRGLVARLAGTAKLVATTRRSDGVAGGIFFDLSTAPESWPDLATDGVDVVFLLAAVTEQKACREDPEGARRINVSHTVELARRLSESGALLVFPSTNLVFDGMQPCVPADAPLSPRTSYGILKSEAEEVLRSAYERLAVVRLSKVLAPDMPLLTQWCRMLKSKSRIQAFSDYLLAPVTLSKTVEVLAAVAERRLTGIFQISPRKEISYAALARLVAERLGASPALVDAVTSHEAGVALEHIPRHVTLDPGRVEKMLGITMPPAEEVVREIVQEELRF